MNDTHPPLSTASLHVGVLGDDAPARRALAQALADALGLPCVEGTPPLAGGVSLQPLALRGQRDVLRSERPGLLLVRLPGPVTPPFDEPGADETVYTATAGADVARQVGALLPRLHRAASNTLPKE
ncbi:MAG: hypothetical protein Q7U73_19495 [Rubrivivax sp.]|nr:hypothetical protein [Rubrivivax sp.]